MKFKISRSLLLQTLNVVSKGLSTKTPMPVLTGIYIDVKQSEITFIATNKEISTKVIIEASEELTIIDSGIVVAPGKYLVDIVKKIDEGFIEISAYEDSNIKIISKNSDFTLTPYNSYNYPRVNFEVNDSKFTLTCKEFKKLVRQTAFACGQSEARIVFTGVNLQITGSELSAIATDTYRLSKRIATIDTVESDIKVNIPSRALDELVKILPDNDDKIEINVSSNVVLFRFYNVYFMSRLIEDNYPETKHLFIRNDVCKIKLNKQEFIQAVDRASLFTTFDSSLCVKLVLKENILEINSASSEVGKVVVKIDPISIEGSMDFAIAFTAKNLIDATKAFDSNTITIALMGEVKPGLISSDEDPELYEILLPIRQF